MDFIFRTWPLIETWKWEPKLDKLPTELASEIVEYIDDHSDLNSLSQTCSFLYNVTAKKRYEIFTIGPDSSFDGQKWSGQFNIEPFLKRPRRPARHLKHVRELHFQADLREALLRGINHCCHHMRYYEQDNDGSMIVDSQRDLERKLRLIFQRIEKGKLRSFSWNMGTCVPARLMGGEGPRAYMFSHQSQLESVSLITDGTCNYNTFGVSPVLLYKLESLKHLSWRGLFSRKNLVDLRDGLWTNYMHLESLELEFFDFEETRRRWTESNPNAAQDNFFARDILQTQPGFVQVLFRSLRTLSLGTFSWGFHTAELAWRFNIAGLHTLKLFNCSDTEKLFRRVYRAAQVWGFRFKLTTFEFQDHNRQMTGDLYSQPNYLQGFLDLIEPGVFQNLYIYVPCLALEVIECLIRCRDRPKRFVFRVDDWGENLDDLYGKLQEYVTNQVLEFLGIPGCILLPLIKKLSDSRPPPEDNPQLNLNHIRPDTDTTTTREQVLSIADWAFRNPHLTTLKAIIWGDFNDPKCKKDRMYLCRNVARPLAAETDEAATARCCEFPAEGLAYREVNVNGDNALWGLIKDEMPFLRACDRRRANTDA